MDREGEVLGDSSGENLDDHSDREEVKEALASGEGYSVRHSASLGEDMVYYCRKMASSEGDIYLVRIAVSGASEWQVFGNILPTIVWFLLLDFLVCLLFTYIETEYIISPVRKLAKDAALNLKLSTKYPELQPIVELLNNRNREVAEQFKELSEEKELVERAQRSKNDFIANITHEMNTPLTSIRGYSELLASGVLNGEQTKTAADTLVKQSDRLSNLIACIINYNEIDNDELPDYEVNISKLASETLDSLAPDIAKRNISLTKDIDADVMIMSRHERLSEVLGNLIRNAIRYNKENGSLFVGIKRKDTGGVRLTVTDTGIGIAEENLERIFERFFT
ncbi:MAG: sensor histidine kinase, partial [Christensenellaceae bacterium]